MPEHMYGGGSPGRESIVDSNGQVRSFVFEARERGIIFDVGHGAGSFYFKHAIPAVEQALTRKYDQQQ